MERKSRRAGIAEFRPKLQARDQVVATVLLSIWNRRRGRQCPHPHPHPQAIGDEIEALLVEPVDR